MKCHSGERRSAAPLIRNILRDGYSSSRYSLSASGFQQILGLRAGGFVSAFEGGFVISAPRGLKCATLENVSRCVSNEKCFVLL